MLEVHNELFDVVMPQVPGATLKIIMAVIGKMNGWQAAEISLTDFENATGLARSTVITAINEALEHDYIRREPYRDSFLYSSPFAAN